MKICIISFLLLCSIALLFSENEFPYEKDGAILWAENCMGCHLPQNFFAAEPDSGYVDELVEAIEFNIYAPDSGMSPLYYLTNNELNRISYFLIYKSHGETWLEENLHGISAQNYGNETCLKCHDSKKLYKEPPPSCNLCHN